MTPGLPDRLSDVDIMLVLSIQISGGLVRLCLNSVLKKYSCAFSEYRAYRCVHNVTIGEPYCLLICPPFSGIIKHLSWAGTTGQHTLGTQTLDTVRRRNKMVPKYPSSNAASRQCIPQYILFQ